MGEEHPLGLAAALDLEGYFVDTTCVKANIHYPIDWVLLRDATRTLIKADPGKAGAKVEFGNVLLLGETDAGIIVDWKLFKDDVPSDNNLVVGTLKRFQGVFGRYPGALATDRGFDDPDNRAFLLEEKIYNAICPKSPRVLKEKLTEDRFVDLNKRRGQTEGRVGIFQNVFLGKPMRSKGFLHREGTARMGRAVAQPLGACSTENHCPVAGGGRTTEDGCLREAASGSGKQQWKVAGRSLSDFGLFNPRRWIELRSDS